MSQSSLLSFVAFFSVVALVLFGAHGFLYLSLRHFFELGDSAKRIILVVLAALSVSFIVSSIVAHYYNNVFTRGFYCLSAVWLGVLTNAVFIFALLWIVSSLVVLVYPALPLPVIGWGVLVLVTLSSAYGLYNAANPIVREDTVYIRNLPASWEGKSVLQLSDVHLGHIIRSEQARRIVEMTRDMDLAAVLIVGDLFDGMDGYLDGLVEPFNGFRSEYGTYFITGNHETYLGTGRTLDIVRKTNINIIDDVLVDLDGLQLVGLASPERGMRRDVAAVMKQIGYDRARPSIVLYHTPTEIDMFRPLGVSLQLAGHTHRGQLYPFNLITSRVFRGYDFGVYREGDHTLSVSSGVGTWGPPMRTNSRAEIVVLRLTGKGFE